MSSIATLIKKSPLYFSLPVSLTLHAAVIAMGFGLPEPSKMNHASLKDFAQTFEVSINVPKTADFLANSNQMGAGSQKDKSRLTSPFASPNPNNENGEDVVKSERSTPDIVPKLEPKLLTTKGKTKKHVKNLPEKEEIIDPDRRDKEISEQTEEIAQLMAEMSKQEEHYAKRPRIHFLDSISAKSAVEAEYINKWSKKLERIGNINFPKKAIRKGLSGTLILNATLDRAGRVTEMQISVSSGSKILDNAALRIVKIAAPYQPLPKEIRKKYDRLNITRTIIFQKKNGKAVFYSK